MAAAKIVSVQEMLELERAAFAAGLTEAALQQRAGSAVAEEVLGRVKPGGLVVVLAGKGNNGRDGAVAAHWLAQQRVRVALALTAGHAVQPDEIERLRTLTVLVAEAPGLDHWRDLIRQADVVVDALAGIGARGALRDPLAGVVQALNETTRQKCGDLLVVSVDVPSGVDADTGAMPGKAVRAAVTVTLGAVKRGLLRFPAAELVGELVVRDIGLPAAATDQLPYQLLDPSSLASTVPARPLGAHKYQFGRCLLVVGCDLYPGAAALATAACARSGAGLATVLTTPFVRGVVAGRVPEATYLGDLPDDPGEVEAVLGNANCAVIGCGLGRSAAAVRLVHRLLDARERINAENAPALVIDGDGLFALGTWPHWWTRLRPSIVLTPHSGELAALRRSDPEIAATASDEATWETAAKLARRWSCTLVAKGPFTTVATPDGRARVWGRANAALATAGTGDVLAGLIGGLLARGLQPQHAAAVGVGAHALAAEAALRQSGALTLVASDLPGEIALQLSRFTASHRPAL